MNLTSPQAGDPDGYTILGAGAIGGTLAWHLARSGHRVVIVDLDTDHVRAIREHGVRLRRDDQTLPQPVSAALTPDEVQEPLRRVLLAVKAHATDGAARWLAPRLAPDGFVVSLQNGLNEAVIAQHIGQQRTVGAFVDLFADIIEPGVISDGGAGALAVGELTGDISPRVRQLVADLQAWGPALATANVTGYLWSKLGFGAMLTATALADAPMAELLHRHRVTAHTLATEIFTVAGAAGIELEPFDAFEPRAYTPSASVADSDAATDRLVAWLSTQAKDRSGIWRDIALHHRPTEIPTHYAPVLALADNHAIPVPLLRALLGQLAEVETDPTSMAESRLAHLDTLAHGGTQQSVETTMVHQ